MILRKSAIALTCLTLLCSSRADAQSATLDRFSASETPSDDFHVSRPTDLGHLRYGVQLHADYANDPLIFEGTLGDAESERFQIVSDQLNLNLGLSLGLFDRLVVFAGLPVTAVMSGDDADDLRAAGIDVSADGAGLADLYAGARVRLYGEADGPFALGLQVTATIPTSGSDQLFRGDQTVSFLPELLAEIRASKVRFVVNVGARVRNDVTAADTNLAFGDELTFALGVAAPVWTGVDPRTHFDLHGQIYGTTMFDDAFAREATPLEGTLGVKFFHQTGLVVGAAAGPGLSRGFGSPDFRGVLMLAYQRPQALEVNADSDGDGLDDAVDECPNDAEDVDAFEDDDGCPEADNDRDGVPDVADGCPMEAEDADGFEDDNGCPDPDNDGDGVLDADDRCPTEAGVAENEGCPDADRDGDTVVDRLDNCPDVAGPPANQGCAEEQRVIIQEDRIDILDVIYFETDGDQIQERSHSLLMNVAQVLNAHPEIERVRVEGHTDARGSRAHNLDLSRRRATSVLRFLVDRGQVPETRLEAQGFGPDRPVVENATTPEEHARNRRVEFKIVGGAGAGVQQQNSGPDAATIDR